MIELSFGMLWAIVVFAWLCCNVVAALVIGYKTNTSNRDVLDVLFRSGPKARRIGGTFMTLFGPLTLLLLGTFVSIAVLLPERK